LPFLNELKFNALLKVPQFGDEFKGAFIGEISSKTY